LSSWKTCPVVDRKRVATAKLRSDLIDIESVVAPWRKPCNGGTCTAPYISHVAIGIAASLAPSTQLDLVVVVQGLCVSVCLLQFLGFREEATLRQS